MTAITRFAPSPTGFLHIGHAASALFSAKQAGPNGRFLLRIEDIDQTRCRPEYVDAIFEDLAWLGLRWEEPVRIQSQHFRDYEKVLDRLTDAGLLLSVLLYAKRHSGRNRADWKCAAWAGWCALPGDLS